MPFCCLSYHYSLASAFNSTLCPPYLVFTHNAHLTAEICLNFLHKVFVTSQQFLWLPRCSAMIAKENSLGITGHQKLLKQPRGTNSFSRSSYIDSFTFLSLDDRWAHPLLLID